MILHAQTPFVQSDVIRPLLSVGELTMSGAEIKFGSKGFWIDLRTDSGLQRMPVRVKGKTCGLTIRKTDAWIIPENSDPAPRAVVAPVEEEIGRAEQPNPLQQRRKLRRHRGQKRLNACGSSEKPATLQHHGRARDSWDNRLYMRNRLRAFSEAVWGKCGLNSSTQRQDESSRNATKHGLKIVPESSQKQEDKVNSVCHELQTNPQLRNEHAMRSHTCRINRGVRGA